MPETNRQAGHATKRARSRRKILEAADRLWTAGSPLAADRRFAVLAEEAGVSRATIVAHFGGKAGVASALLWFKLEPVRVLMADGGAEDGELVEVLRRGLFEALRVCRENRTILAETMIGVTNYTADHGKPVGATDDPRTHAPFPLLFRPTLERMAAAGLLRSGSHAADMAAALGNIIVLTAFTRPEPSDDATWAVEALLFGALRDRG